MTSADSSASSPTLHISMPTNTYVTLLQQEGRNKLEALLYVSRLYKSLLSELSPVSYLASLQPPLLVSSYASRLQVKMETLKRVNRMPTSQSRQLTNSQSRFTKKRASLDSGPASVQVFC